MYAILKGVPRISNQKIADIIGDRLAFIIDSVELEKFGEARIAVIFDEAYENSVDEGGTIDYDAMVVGTCGIARFRSRDYNPENPETTIQQALDNLKEYLDRVGYTDWEVVEVSK